jgi:hypothetical protein
LKSIIIKELFERVLTKTYGMNLQFWDNTI